MGETTVSTRVTARAGTAALCAGVILGATECAGLGAYRGGCGAGGVSHGHCRVRLRPARGVAESMVPDTHCSPKCAATRRPVAKRPRAPRGCLRRASQRGPNSTLVDASTRQDQPIPGAAGVPAAGRHRRSCGPPSATRRARRCRSAGPDRANQSSNGTKLADGLAREIPPYWTNPVPLQSTEVPGPSQNRGPRQARTGTDRKQTGRWRAHGRCATRGPPARHRPPLRRTGSGLGVRALSTVENESLSRTMFAGLTPRRTSKASIACASVYGSGCVGHRRRSPCSPVQTGDRGGRPCSVAELRTAGSKPSAFRRATSTTMYREAGSRW